MAIKGSLREASLPDVVQLLYLGRRTGCLSVASDRNFASIWFDEGWIIFAGLLTRTDRIGDQVRVAEHRLVDDHHLHQTLPSASYRMVAAETSGEEGSNDPMAARGNSWPSVTKAPGAVGTLASS